MSRERLTKGQLAMRLWKAQLNRAARLYSVGDPVRARRFINIGEVGNPTVVAHPGDPGVIVAVKAATEEHHGILAVQFGEAEPVDLTPVEIEPDWEE
jgi:hypothetical protein